MRGFGSSLGANVGTQIGSFDLSIESVAQIWFICSCWFSNEVPLHFSVT